VKHFYIKICSELVGSRKKNRFMEYFVTPAFVKTTFHCIESIVRNHVKWVPCHYGMACPQVVDGGQGLQVWRVAANILNKQSRTADKGWPSSLGVGRGANNSPP
jgi:hypothetical protein